MGEIFWALVFESYQSDFKSVEAYLKTRKPFLFFPYLNSLLRKHINLINSFFQSSAVVDCTSLNELLYSIVELLEWWRI